MSNLIKVAQEACRFTDANMPDFRVGDTISVHIRIQEKEKERIQRFQGAVIRIAGKGPYMRNVTVMKVQDGIGVERIFPMPSPVVAKVEVKKRGIVSQARLYYLRDKIGKARYIKNKI